MARVNTNIGDVFSVNINNVGKKYLQFIASDLTQLNSDVVRAFEKVYPVDIDPNLSEIVNGKIEFYAHCITKLGTKLGYWEKVGNIPEIGDINNVIFRGTNDYGSKPGEQIIVSNNWYIWKVNQDFTRVGKLTSEYQKAEIGIVISPDSIVHRMITGVYDFLYPKYE